MLKNFKIFRLYHVGFMAIASEEDSEEKIIIWTLNWFLRF